MKNNDRFIITYVKGNSFTVATMILVDKVTGVNYLFTREGYAGGLTPLYDKEGKIVVTPVINGTIVE